MRKEIIGICGIIALLLVAGCVQTGNNPANPVGNNTPTTTTTGSVHTTTLAETAGHEHHLFEQYAKQHGKTLEETKKFFKEVYGLNEESDIYAALPIPSERIATDANLLQYGNGIDLGAVPAESYLQPEFFPSFLESGISAWIDAPETSPAVVGTFSTPAEQSATLGEDQNEFVTTLFVGSAYGVTYYQGMGFRYTITPKGSPIELEFNPKEVLLGPTFPRFDAGWMHQITVTGKIKGKLAPGKYTIGVYPNDASDAAQNEWYAQHQPYTSGNGVIAPSNGLATFELTVP